MKRLLIISACLTFWLLGAWGSASAQDWKPVDPAHLALKAPVVDPNADAEAIFWEISIADNINAGTGDSDTAVRNYLRIKVFTERGKEAGEVKLPFDGETRIRDVAGRTIKPDGSIVELKRDAVFERTVVKEGKRKILVKSFALPAVEPGCIIEYRWTEYRETYRYVSVPIQREIPVQLLAMRIRPASIPNFTLQMQVKVFNGDTPAFKDAGRGFYGAEFRNLPAFQEESNMPPEDEVRQWMLLYYTEDPNIAPAKYWKDIGKQTFKENEGRMKVTDEVRAAVTAAAGNAATTEQKLEQAYNFCQSKIRNAAAPGVSLTPDEYKKLAEVKSPADTLKRGYGTPRQINLLFAAMANALGYNARLARVADRSDIFFKPGFPSDFSLRRSIVALQMGGEWRFFDPAVPGTRFGQLRWREEGISALISDPKEPNFVTTPISKPEDSLAKRTGTLTLDESGTLTGVLRFEYTGHSARDWRLTLTDEAAAQQEEIIRNDIQSFLSTEVSDIVIENLTEPGKPLIVTCKINASGYAKRTGKRLVLPVSVFENGAKPKFRDTTRRHDIYLEYPWAEQDEVTFSLPEGFELDNANAPESFPLPSNYGKYETKLLFNAGEWKLIYRRSFSFGKTTQLLWFPKSAYETLKIIFNDVHKQDEHAVILKVK